VPRPGCQPLRRARQRRAKWQSASLTRTSGWRGDHSGARHPRESRRLARQPVRARPATRGSRPRSAMQDQDPEVRSVLLDISSPGGEAAGMAGLADLIRSVRQTEACHGSSSTTWRPPPPTALPARPMKSSISPTSMVGSIGVVMLHADRSGELAARGVKPTLIFAGSHKVDGNPFEPLVGRRAGRSAGQRRRALPASSSRSCAGRGRPPHCRHGARDRSRAPSSAPKPSPSVSPTGSPASTRFCCTLSRTPPRPSGRNARKGGNPDEHEMMGDSRQADEAAGISDHRTCRRL